ncbi:unnamed protein product [Tuber aestivum]|uniref:Uncharacterized protein n=1 Tax=Tuber aestivum TaxID=59557 RepID=A0A292PLZ4_9PEZI|nr:unnamed protein product [Tuber aestivum]
MADISFSSVSPLPALGLGEYEESGALIGCGSPSTLTLQAFWWWVRPGSFGVVARSDVGCLPAAHSIRSATPTVFSHTARSHTTPFPPIQTRLANSLIFVNSLKFPCCNRF